MQVSVDLPLVALPDGVHSTMFKGGRPAPPSGSPVPRSLLCRLLPPGAGPARGVRAGTVCR